jgi:hypothetical protein
MARKFSLNNATSTQLPIMSELNKAANLCPPVSDREAFALYQEKVMQPIRDRIIEAGSNYSKAAR